MALNNAWFWKGSGRSNCLELLGGRTLGVLLVDVGSVEDENHGCALVEGVGSEVENWARRIGIGAGEPMGSGTWELRMRARGRGATQRPAGRRVAPWDTRGRTFPDLQKLPRTLVEFCNEISRKKFTTCILIFILLNLKR